VKMVVIPMFANYTSKQIHVNTLKMRQSVTIILLQQNVFLIHFASGNHFNVHSRKNIMEVMMIIVISSIKLAALLLKNVSG
jgi:hypothetical protein